MEIAEITNIGMNNHVEIVGIWKFFISVTFTQGQFGLSGIVVACVCVCAGVCINHKIVRAMTHHPFKLGSRTEFGWDV